MSGQNIPVPVVDHNGNFQGWATFHVVSADGGSDKHIKGYFVSPFVNERLTIKACGFGGCPRYLGSPTLQPGQLTAGRFTATLRIRWPIVGQRIPVS